MRPVDGAEVTRPDVVQASAGTTTGGRRPLRVLLVEDERVVLALALAMLTADDRFCVVGCVESVAGALRALSDGGVDVVLLDHDLPDGDAGAVLQRLRDQRADDGGRVVPVLLHTARDDAPAVASALGVPFVRKGGPWPHLLDELARLGDGS